VSQPAWIEANQLALTREVAEIKLALERHRDRHEGAAPAPQIAPQENPVSDGDALSAVDAVTSAFALSPFERRVLVLCAAVELDGSVASLCAAAAGDPQRSYPTFALALAAFPDAHWSAIVPASPLRHWRLVEVTAGQPLTSGPLRVDERVLHFLAGIEYVAEQLDGLARPLPPAQALPPSQQHVAERLAAHLRDRSARDSPITQLCGADRRTRDAVAAAAFELVGRRVCALAAEAVPVHPAEHEGLLRLWEREAALGGAGLLVDCDDLNELEPGRRTAVERLIDRIDAVAVVSARDLVRGLRRESLRLDVGKPTAEEQAQLWRDVLRPHADLNGSVEVLSSQFDLDPYAIATVAASLDGPGGNDDLETRLWDECRRLSRPRLDDLAQRIVPAAAWDDIVLPAPQREVLREITIHVRHRARVYETWGFRAKSSRGLGIAALFAGPSGTGKTMAAEVLADELRLDLYRIDLSAVVSKYIGETEKNLRRLFDAAEGSGAILLFDEADALFGKRTEVKDSHDRYANIEVSYLLQRMEAYRGLAILTTNLVEALDPAFRRRLRFLVQFPFPNEEQRREIWERTFPQETPRRGLDVARLGRLDLAGGNIRNIGLSAAFLAAEADDAVEMSHVARAARAEYAKLERPLPEIDWTVS